MDRSASSPRRTDRVICIGDIHGNLKELILLWNALKNEMKSIELIEATVIFLGDYVDR